MIRINLIMIGMMTTNGRKKKTKKRKRKYQLEAGKWIDPKRKFFKLICCKCGLTHAVEFRLRDYITGGKTIQLRMWLWQDHLKNMKKKHEKRT